MFTMLLPSRRLLLSGSRFLFLFLIFYSCAPAPVLRPYTLVRLEYGHKAGQVGREEIEGSLIVPSHLFVSQNGMIYLADPYNCVVSVFDRAGKFSFSVGGRRLGLIQNIAVSPMGDIYVYCLKENMESAEIVKFNNIGRFIFSIPVSPTVLRMGCDVSGNLFIFLAPEEPFGWRVRYYSPEGNLIGTVTVRESDFAKNDYTVNIDDILLDPRGSLLVVSVSYYKGTKFKQRACYIGRPTQNGTYRFENFLVIKNDRLFPYFTTYQGDLILWETIDNGRYRYQVWDISNRIKKETKELRLSKPYGQWQTVVMGWDGRFYGIKATWEYFEIVRFK